MRLRPACKTRGRRIWPALAAVLWLFAWSAARAQKPVAAQGFEGFKMVRTRNIFDPDRRPPPSQNGSSAAAAASMVPTDYVALTGTLVTPDKTLAFFSGSRADFDQVLGPKGTIAGATITKISPGNVTIERAGKAATVAVGWTVPLNNGAASALAPAPAADVQAALGFGGGGAPASAAAANPPPGVAAPGTSAPAATPNADVARMMRERRQHESQ